MKRMNPTTRETLERFHDGGGERLVGVRIVSHAVVEVAVQFLKSVLLDKCSRHPEIK